MGLTKPNNYEQEELRFATIAMALAHPARNRIIEHLQNEVFLIQAMLPQYLNLNKTSVNRHLRLLKSAGLIDEYYTIHYAELRLNEQTLQYFHEKLQSLLHSDE